MKDQMAEIVLLRQLAGACEYAVLMTLARHAEDPNDLRSLVMSTLDMIVIKLIASIEPERHYQTIVGVHAEHVLAGLKLGMADRL